MINHKSFTLLHSVLLLLFLVPLMSSARQETMEERKKRIARRYIRERNAVAASVADVPVDTSEQEEELMPVDSRQSELVNAEKAGNPIPRRMPVRRRRPPTDEKGEGRNWLLTLEPEEDDGLEDESGQNNWYEPESQLQQFEYENMGNSQSGKELFSNRRASYSRRDDRLKDDTSGLKRGESGDASTGRTSRYESYSTYTTTPRLVSPFDSQKQEGQGRPAWSLQYNGRELQSVPSRAGTDQSGSSYTMPKIDTSGSSYKKRQQPGFQGQQFREYENLRIRQPYQPHPVGSDRNTQKNEQIRRQRPIDQWKKSSVDPRKDNSYLNEVLPNQKDSWRK